MECVANIESIESFQIQSTSTMKSLYFKSKLIMAAADSREAIKEEIHDWLSQHGDY